MEVKDNVQIEDKIFVVTEIKQQEFENKKLNKTIVTLEELKEI